MLGMKHGPPRTSRGFTLVETLVVVIIVGVLVTLVTVNLAGDSRARLRADAETLARRLAHAQDEALLTGVRVAWRGDEAGYRFLAVATDGGWEAVERDDALRPRNWTQGVRLASIDRSGRALAGEPLIVFRASGLNEPYRVVLADGAERASIESDGLRAPFITFAER